MIDIEKRPYVLDATVHAQVITNIKSLSDVAQVPVHMIERSSVAYLRPTELKWLLQFKQHRKFGTGLLITGALQSIAPVEKMMAIAAVLIRSFVDARVISAEDIAKAEHVAYEPTCLCIYNLYDGTKKPDWRMQKIYDRLVRRQAASKPTVVYVENMQEVTNLYGKIFALHLESTSIESKLL